MSNQSPFFPSSGFPSHGQASSFLGHMPRLSTRANLIAFVVIGFFGTIAYAFASLGKYVHFGFWRLVWVAAWCVIGLVAAIACAVLFAFLRRRKRRAEAEGTHPPASSTPLSQSRWVLSEPSSLLSRVSTGSP